MTITMLRNADTIVVYFDATQEARHTAMLRMNEMAKAAVERSRAAAAGRADEDGVVPDAQPLRLTLGIAEDDLTAKQRGFLHAAVLPQIAEQYTFPDGTRYVAAIWKEHFRQRFLGDRWVMKAIPRWDEKQGRMVQPKRKTPHRERISTEELSVKQYSQHIDRVIDTAVAELGVVFDFDAAQREEVRYVKTKRAAKLQSAVTA